MYSKIILKRINKRGTATVLTLLGITLLSSNLLFVSKLNAISGKENDNNLKGILKWRVEDPFELDYDSKFELIDDVAMSANNILTDIDTPTETKTIKEAPMVITRNEDIKSQIVKHIEEEIHRQEEERKEKERIEEERIEKQRKIEEDRIKMELEKLAIKSKEEKKVEIKNKTGIAIGKTPMPERVDQYRSIVDKWSKEFKVDSEIVNAIIAQESKGKSDLSKGPGWGLMQIENTVLEEFYSFGKKYFNQNWNTYDRLDPEKNIAFGTYRLKQNLDHYKGDYLKAIQAYNFSHYSLDMLIKAKGDSWPEHRKDIAFINGHFKREGKTSYGDPIYIENVLQYYRG